ncbi:hypothetical protein VTP01DRAFT_1957 [Rhizomucor pusillus]|uniref:uncharacterized protein n=1 Tax=Rhizomucor pusillus TaxID=4840 RepID=UPI0037445B15
MEAMVDTNSWRPDDVELRRLDSINMSIYRSDYDVVEPGKGYKVIAFGFGQDLG